MIPGAVAKWIVDGQDDSRFEVQTPGPMAPFFLAFLSGSGEGIGFDLTMEQANGLRDALAEAIHEAGRRRAPPRHRR
jgi:hypothetical protein